MPAAGDVIVLDQGKEDYERAHTAAIRGKMLQDTVGNVGKNIMDIVTQYEDIKDKKQKQDLAAITMAGTLSGGMDKLPQETKNRLPGIIGYPLPTDANGDVQITPDTATMIQRQSLAYVQAHPEAGGILAGVVDKAPNPADIANQVHMQEMKSADQRAKDAAENARNQAANAAKVEAANIGKTGRIEAAKITANKQNKDELPSPFILDPHDGTVKSEPQWYQAHPGEAMPAKLSRGDANLLVNKQKADSAVQAHQAAYDSAQARIRTMDFHLKSLMASQDPYDLNSKKLKSLTELVKLWKGTDSVPDQQIQKQINEQMPDIMRNMGYNDEQIAGLTATVGQGGWVSYLNNWVNTFMGTTASESGPLLKQDDIGPTAHIPGVSEPVNVQSSGKPPGGGGGKVLNPEESLNWLNQP